MHLLQSRTDEAIIWAERARNANSARPYPHTILSSAYALKGDIEPAGSELAEVRSLRSDEAYSSIARNRATVYLRAKDLRATRSCLCTALRKVGMPEE